MIYQLLFCNYFALILKYQFINILLFESFIQYIPSYV